MCGGGARRYSYCKCRWCQNENIFKLSAPVILRYFFFVRQDNLTLEVELYKIGFLSFLKEEEEIIQSVEIIHDETDCNRISHF